MSKLAKGLLAVFVLAACAGGAPLDSSQGDSKSVGTNEPPSVQPKAESANLSSNVAPQIATLLQRTCARKLDPLDREALRKANAPASFTEPLRIMPKGSATDIVRAAKGFEATYAEAVEAAGAKRGRIEAVFPKTSAEALHVGDPKSGLAADVTLVGARAVTPSFYKGMLVYAQALSDASMVVVPSADGPEDYLLYETKPSNESASYKVVLGSDVRMVHLVAGNIELVDAWGVPRLRMSAPEIFDASCKRIEPTVTVTGCVVDTNPVRTVQRPPGATAKSSGEARTCDVKLDWTGKGVSYPATLDPTWSTAGRLAKRRAGHTATKTVAGGSSVVVVAGSDDGGDPATVEVYDEATDTWSVIGQLIKQRKRHAATKLADGRVLVVAGKDPGNALTGEVDIIDVGASTITAGPPLPEATASLTLTTLPNGKVVALGGEGAVANHAYVFDPVASTWATITMPSQRIGHAAVLVGSDIYMLGGITLGVGEVSSVWKYSSLPAPNGSVAAVAGASISLGGSGARAVKVPGNPERIFALGGTSGTPSVGTLPALTSWTASPAHQSGYVLFPALALRDTGPIVSGGWGYADTAYTKTTLYDNLAVALPGPELPAGRWDQSLTVLDNGKALSAGGYAAQGSAARTVDLLTDATCTSVADCDDTNPCTVDACGVGGTCTHIANNPTASCDDGNKCNGISTCSDTGQCLQTTPAVNVPAANLCGTCDPATGNLIPKPAGTSCSKANPADPVSFCQTAGHCDGTGPLIGACKTIDAPEGTSCDPSGAPNLCTGRKECAKVSGVMTCATRPGLQALATVQTDPCSTTSCDPARGIVTTRDPMCGVVNPAPPGPQPTETTFDASTDFLLAPGMGQHGATISATRRAVVRGYVRALNTSGVPIVSTITVSVKDHPEYLSTTADANGAYALVVDGGGDLVIQFKAANHITADRHVKPDWHKFAILDDVALVEREPATTVHQGSGSYQAVTGSPRGQGEVPTLLANNRQALLLFPPNVSSPALPAGDFNVSITEVTAFAAGASAMPASLPPASGYTYAMDIAIDGVPEGTDVPWKVGGVDTPVPFYVENFPGMPTGASVPLGHYDRTKAAWIPAASGIVFNITAIDATTNAATVEPVGAVPAAELVALGTHVKTKYPGGAFPRSFWRVELPHFSVWDCNWGFGPPANAGSPPKAPPTPAADPIPDPPECRGSILECPNQVLGEDLPLAGTPYSLHYRSDRHRIANRTIRVPITDGRTFGSGAGQVAVPKRIDVDIDIAGQRTRVQRLPPYSNWDTLEWTWDGKDAFGREVEGSTPATTTVHYAYEGSVGSTATFGQFGGSPISGSRANREISIDQSNEIVLGGRAAEGLGFGGWNFSAQGMRDDVRNRYLTGTGRRVDTGRVVEVVAGRGTGGRLDGAPAVGAGLLAMTAVAVGPDGMVYFAENSYKSVRSIIDGNLVTVAGNAASGSCNAPWPVGGGAEIPASSLCIEYASSMAVGPDGFVYVADFDLDRIVKFSPLPGGVARIVAGLQAGTARGSTPIATPQLADQTALQSPRGLAFDREGNLYFSETGTNYAAYNRVRPDGWVEKVAGSGLCSSLPAVGSLNSSLTSCVWPFGGISIANDGSIFAASSGHIRKLRPDGVMELVLGAGAGATRGGSDATSTFLTSAVNDLVWTTQGIVYTDSSARQIRRIAPDGKVQEVAGRYYSPAEPPAPAWSPNPLNHGFQGNGWLGRAPTGDVIYSAQDTLGRPYIERLIDRSPDEIAVDEDTAHVLDGTGTHVSTKSRKLGITLETLGYTDGLLSSVTDQFGHVTTIARPDANTVVITAPDGVRRTTLGLANGYIETVTDPDGIIHLTHDANGLLTSYTDRRAKVHEFEYNAQARLIRDRGPLSPSPGPGQTLTESLVGGVRSVVHNTAEGRTKIWEVNRLPNASKPTLLETRAVKQQTASTTFETTTDERFAEHRELTTYPDAHSVEVERELDPKFGVAGKYAAKTTLRASPTATLVTAHSRTIDGNGSTVDTYTRHPGAGAAAATSTSSYDALTHTEVRSSAAGRVVTTTLDPTTGQPTAVQIGTGTSPDIVLAPVEYFYYSSGIAAGKLWRVVQGSRTTEYEYNELGELSRVTTPAGETSYSMFDAAGRPQVTTLPGVRAVQTSYDVEGNTTSVIPPGGVLHSFERTAVNQLMSYQAPPGVPAVPRVTSYDYDQDELLRKVASPQPSPGPGLPPPFDKTIERDYAGRVTKTLESAHVREFGYTNGHQTVAKVAGVNLTRAFTESLLQDETQIAAGKPSLKLARSYDADLRVSGFSFFDNLVLQRSLAIGYDKDSFVTSLGGVGGLTIVRDNTAGLINSMTIGAPALVETLQYDGFGAPLAYGGTYNSVAQGSLGLTYDAAGRIETKVDAWSFPVVPVNAPMSSATWTYSYDTAGRLASANDTVTTYDYTYDARGNRNVVEVDEQDRATQIGSPWQPDFTNYTYDAHGNVATRTVDAATQSYSWDSEGSLLAVTGAATVSYHVDANGRRVARTEGGFVTHQWMYDGQLRIVGEVVYVTPTQPTARYRVYGYVGERRLPVVMLEKVGAVETTYRLFGDHLGSLRAVVRVSDGKAVQWMRHGPWGEIVDDFVVAGFARVPFGFAAGIYDEATGLVRFGAREYDPRTGRWLSKDAARFGGGENFYAYADGDPVDVVDPSGMVGQPRSSVPMPEESASETPVGGVCKTYPPGSHQWCSAQIDYCLWGCAARARRVYLACLQSNLEKYGEDKDHMCRDVRTEITASCLPTCDPSHVCRRT